MTVASVKSKITLPSFIIRDRFGNKPRLNSLQMEVNMRANMWLGSSLTFSPYIFLLGFLRHQNVGKGEEVASPISKNWNRGVFTIDLSCLDFKKIIFRDSWTGMIDISGYKRGILWHTYTHTYTHTRRRTHEHTHRDTQFNFFCWLRGVNL